jgi:amidohydrolase
MPSSSSSRFRAQIGAFCAISALLVATFSTGKIVMSDAHAVTLSPSISGPLPGYSARDLAFDAEVQAMFPKLVEMRRDFHMHPELSNREERTGRVVAERLRALGLEVKTNIARHGVIGVLKGGKPGKVIALRADMDALPITETRDAPYKSQNAGVMHACGHDVHTTVGLGTAELLAKHRAEIPGTVMFIFQPAEEGAPRGEEGGAKLMLQEGAFDDPKPDAVFGLHCFPSIEVGQVACAEASAMASSDRFLITIRGKKVHGAYPHQGVDAIVVAAAAVEQLQTIRSRRIDTQEPLVLSIGSVRGGNRFNIIADEVQMEGTVRTLSDPVHEQIEPMMRRILQGVTESYGASFALEYERLVPVTKNDTALVRKMLPTLQRIVGNENIAPTRAQMGGEDFSYFANRVPGVFYFLGVGNKKRGITAMIHTPDFDVDEQCLAVGVKTMAAMALDFLNENTR